MLKPALLLLILLAASASVAASESIVYGWKVTAVGNVVLTTPYKINCVWIPNNNLVKRCSVVLDVTNAGNPVNVNKNTVGLISRAFNATQLTVQRSTTYSNYVENYSINSMNSVNVTRRKFTNWLNASNTVSLQRGVTGVKISFLLPKYAKGLFNATIGSFVVDPEVTECGVINAEGYYYLTQNISGETCIQFQDDTARDIDFNCDGYSVIFANGRAFDSIGDASQSNITIRNCVIDCSLYQPDKPCVGSKGISAYSESNWNITNNTILMNYGTESESPRDNYGIHFHDGGNGGSITNNFIDLTNSVTSYSVYLEALNINVTNNVFFGSDNGVVTSGSDNISFNTFFNTTNYCWQGNAPENASNNNFTDCGNAVILSGDVNLFENNVVNNTTGTCVIITANNASLLNNNVSYCGWWQETPNPSTAFDLLDSDYANVSGNRIEYANNGVQLASGSNNRVSNNVIENLNGVCVYLATSNSTVSNNYCNKVFYGLQSGGSSTSILFANNTLVGNWGLGLVVSANNITFYNNSVRDFLYGVYVYDGYANTRFINCNTTSNTYDVYFGGLNSNLSFQNHSFQGVTTNFTGYRVWLNSTLSKPTDPATFYNISKYVNATNHTANGWLAINFSYSETDLGSVSEATLRVARFNASWETDASKFAGAYGVDTANNYVYANVTKFTATNALFAALGQVAAAGWSHKIYWIANANIGKVYWIAKTSIAKIYGVS